MKNTNNSNNTFRTSKIERILSLISESGVIEEVMQDLEKAMGGKGLDVKKLFFSNLTPMGREAFKLAYQAIDNEYAVLMEHEDKAIRENWFTHFVEYHNQILEKLKEGGDTIFTYVIQEFGDDFINDVFRQDMRSLEEIVDIVGKNFVEAEKLKKQNNDKLKEKLHTQLQDVVATLNELTVGNDSEVKNFEIHTKGAVFEITTHNEEGRKCTCGHCGEGEGEDLEELIQKLMSNIGFARK